MYLFSLYYKKKITATLYQDYGYSLKTNPNFNTNAPPFEVRVCKVILGGTFYAEGGCKMGLGGAKLKTVLGKRHDFCLQFTDDKRIEFIWNMA